MKPKRVASFFRISVFLLFLFLFPVLARAQAHQAYVKLRTEPGGTAYRLESNELRFTFFEPYAYDQDLEYEIRDENGNLIIEVNSSFMGSSTFLVPHTHGMNEVALDLSTLSLVSGTYYQLRVFAGKNDTHHLLFLKP